jgi:predicted transcriptional regulator
MSEEEWLADFIKQVGPEALRRAADNELDYARARFKRSVERLFEREVARIAKLIEEPGRYSVKEWEKVRTYFEWIARRFKNLVEQMEQARPLTTIDDTPVKDAVLKPGGGKPKLTESEVSHIKTLVNERKLSLEEIAAQFNISPAEVSAIKNERTWPEVEPRIVGRLDRYEAKGEANVSEADERSGAAVINKDAAETPLSPPEHSRVTPADGGDRGRAAPSNIRRRF